MMFLNYFVWGTWYTTLTTYLTATLKFSGSEAGLVFGTTAVACMISPFFVGLVADRFFSTERVIATVHLIGAGLLVVASQVTSFWPLYGVMLLYNLCYFPTISLTNSLAMRQASEPGRQFPMIRMFGTFGWIAVSNVIGSMGIESTSTPFLIGAGASLAMAGFSLFLPHTPPAGKGQVVNVRSILGLDALAMTRDRSFTVLLMASFLACIPLTFYFSFTNAYLNEAQVKNAASVMSLGQVTEVGMMLLMPFIFRRLTVKNILVMGLVCWAVRYGLLGAGNANDRMWMFYLAILLHGACYDFFFMTGQLYTDQKAPRHLRGAAQGLITFVTYGLGMFTGSWLSGVTVDYFTVMRNGVAMRDWSGVWTTAGGASLLILVMIVALFRSREKVHVSEPVKQEALASA